ncbi:molecular chaperone-like protein [Methylorubrum thiocyanatum]|uniref:Molecular chaperone-like protein n=1 Tax=Methylorubrum thiocyanatum TaxID=47958 RepID=A0AA40RZL9_9HYPH|nr:molecular chaperone-like protein [Methylorubrum thiocyanatum]MBA8911860.1 hypothetical protein [Methylorubrum thiocyanatum]GJE79847.1 hypothetical protein CJNNKLLH_1176 [Methylorubrum thiocyanatum]
MTRFRPIALLAVLLFAVAAITVVVLRATSDAPSTARDTAKAGTTPACDPPTPGAEPRSPDCPQSAPPTARTP